MSTDNVNLVVVGHVDHGKSTLMGRLLADAGAIPEERLEQVRTHCKRQGREIEYAFLFDAFLEEQQQGVTIDLARAFYYRNGRRFTILDAPGHKEFLKNMVTGATRADAALLVVDAAEGVQAQSRRHALLLALLGVRQIIVVTTKMDLVAYARDRFDTIAGEIATFLADQGLRPLAVVPASAHDGDNITQRSTKMSWFEGPTVLECLDGLSCRGERTERPLRFPVQTVLKLDERRIVAGRIEAGSLRVDDLIVFSPSNSRATVRTIEAFSAPTVLQARAGQSIGITLQEPVFVERGEVASHVEKSPSVSTRFRARIFWLGKGPLTVNRPFQLRLHTQQAVTWVETIHEVVEADSLELRLSPAEVARFEVGEVTLRTRTPLALDQFAECESTGRFVIISEGGICGGGTVSDVVSDEQERFRREARQRDMLWRESEVSAEERAERYGHRAGLVLATGPAGSGKARLVRYLERSLFDSGRHVVLLDSKNLRLGLEADMDAELPGERARRFGEVAEILLRTGHIVVAVTNEILTEDHAIILELVKPYPVVYVRLGTQAEGEGGLWIIALQTLGDVSHAGAQVLRSLAEVGVLQ
jgi:bifunctional enzyme CysN/CysC